MLAVTPGQASDSPALKLLLAELRVFCQGPGLAARLVNLAWNGLSALEAEPGPVHSSGGLVRPSETG